MILRRKTGGLEGKRFTLHGVQLTMFELSYNVIDSSIQSLRHVRLWDPMNCSTPGFPVHHQLPELAQTHIHWVSDAIQPSHPQSSPSPTAFNFSQHQGLFQWIISASGGQSIGASASVFLVNTQGWFPLGLTDLILQPKRLSRVFSSTTVWKHQFFRALYGPTLTSVRDLEGS